MQLLNIITITNPETQLQVLPSPDVHSLVVRSDVDEVLHVDGEQPARHRRGRDWRHLVAPPSFLVLGNDVPLEGEPPVEPSYLRLVPTVVVPDVVISKELVMFFTLNFYWTYIQVSFRKLLDSKNFRMKIVVVVMKTVNQFQTVCEFVFI